MICNEGLRVIVECTRNVTNNTATYLNAVKLVNQARVFKREYKDFVVILPDIAPIHSVLHLMSSTNVIFERDIDKFLEYVKKGFPIAKLDKYTSNYLLEREGNKQLKPVTASMMIPRTLQEKKIEKFLSKEGYDFKFGYPILNKFHTKHFVDFMLINKKGQRVVIEVTNVDKPTYKNTMMGAIRLWKTIHFSKNYYFPDAYYIGILSHSDFDLTKYGEVYEIGSICDDFVLNNNLKDLRKILNGDLDKSSKDLISEKRIVQLWNKFS